MSRNERFYRPVVHYVFASVVEHLNAKHVMQIIDVGQFLFVVRLKKRYNHLLKIFMLKIKMFSKNWSRAFYFFSAPTQKYVVLCM